MKTPDQLKAMLHTNGLPTDYFNVITKYTPRLATKMLNIAIHRSPRNTATPWAIELMETEKLACLEMFTKKAKKRKTKAKTVRKTIRRAK